MENSEVTEIIDPKHALIIVNPVSGGGNKEKIISDIYQKAKNLGWEGHLVQTTFDKRANLWAEEAIERGSTHIIVCGGDGTVREALSAVIDNDVSLGIIPMGTGNAYAQDLGIPFDISNSVLTALFGKVEKFDVGIANNNFFVLVAGVGIDVDAMSTTDVKTKSRMGVLGYFVNGLGSLITPNKFYKVVLDDNIAEWVKAKSILVANIGKTVGNLEIVPGASPKSGKFKIAIIEAQTFYAWFDLGIKTLLKRISLSTHYKLYEATKVEISESGGHIKYECDGDVFSSEDKVQISIYKKKLSVAIPSFGMANKALSLQQSQKFSLAE